MRYLAWIAALTLVLAACVVVGCQSKEASVEEEQQLDNLVDPETGIPKGGADTGGMPGVSAPKGDAPDEGDGSE
jgi:hypothetical protein